MVNAIIGNVYLWIVASLFLLAFDLLFAILLILIARKTHAIEELKAWKSGNPIALFFRENRYCEWKPIKVIEGIVQDRKYGAFIINQRATYVDKTTKNVLLPFDASYNPDIKVSTDKLVGDFAYLVKDEEEMKKLRIAIAEKNIEETKTLQQLTAEIHLGAIKNMTTALVPHNIVQKIEKIISARIKRYGEVDIKVLIILFGAVFGIIVLGTIIMKSMGV